MDFARKNVIILGRLKTTTRGVMEAKLRSAGARLHHGPHPSTHIAILGAKVGQKRLRHLQELDIPTMTEGEANTDLDATQTPHTPTLAANATLATLRALLIHEPGEATFKALCSALDQAHPEALTLAVDYASQHLKTWPAEVSATLSPQFGLNPQRYTRKAPAPWLSSLLQGEQSSKLALATALDLGGTHVSGKDAITLLAHPGLAGLRAFDPGQNKLSATFYKKLLTSKWTSLRHLTLRHMTPQLAKGLAKQCTLPSLNTITIGDYRSSIGQGYAHLFEANWLPQLEAIGVNQRQGVTFLARVCEAAEAGRLPKLRTLTLDSPTHIRLLLKSGLGQQLTALAIPANLNIAHAQFEHYLDTLTTLITHPESTLTTLHIGAHPTRTHRYSGAKIVPPATYALLDALKAGDAPVSLRRIILTRPLLTDAVRNAAIEEWAMSHHITLEDDLTQSSLSS